MFRTKPYHLPSNSKAFQEYWSNRAPIGILKERKLELLEIVFGIEDFVIIRDMRDNKSHRCKLHIDSNDNMRIKYGNMRIRLDEFVSTNYPWQVVSPEEDS